MENRAGSHPAPDPAADAGGPPSPARYRHIGLAATATLRHGPTSPLARLLRELGPYLREYEPHIHALEGSYRTILSCGLLRNYPAARLHCLPPGRLGGLVDLGAGVVGRRVAGLDAALGTAANDVAEQLQLGLDLDLVVYLVDPLAATSAMPETLALARECVVANKPFLDTYGAVVEWFGLLGYVAAGDRVPDCYAGDRDLERLGFPPFPHTVVALIAHDTRQPEMVAFAQEHFDFLGRFRERIGTGGTAARVNRDVSPERPWVTELEPGARGGGLQIGEALAMGLCDALLSFEDPAPELEQGVGAQHTERSARLTNLPDRLAGPSEVVCLHDWGSATTWAQLWEHVLEQRRPRAAPTTVTAAFRRLFDVDLVLAEPPRGAASSWPSITEEAAWYLLSSIAAKAAYDGQPGEPRRVTVSCGGAVRDVLAHTDPTETSIGAALCERIAEHNRLHYEAVWTSMAAAGPALARYIDLIARRKELTLAIDLDIAALWSIGSVVVAPMVGDFQPVPTSTPCIEAGANAGQLARNVGAKQLEPLSRARRPITFPAFIAGNTAAPDELDRHWGGTDILLTACDDLGDHWFADDAEVQLPPGMYDHLKASDAIGEVAGLYLRADGEPVEDPDFRRQGMDILAMQRLARRRDGSAAILVASAHRRPDGDGPDRIGTVLAALRARVVSVLVTDLPYAKALLHEHARDPSVP